MEDTLTLLMKIMFGGKIIVNRQFKILDFDNPEKVYGRGMILGAYITKENSSKLEVIINTTCGEINVSFNKSNRNYLETWGTKLVKTALF